MSSLTGKVAVITGASAGIGLAIARNLAAQGATLYLISRDTVRGQRVVAEIGAQSGNSDLHYIAADLTIQRQVYNAVESLPCPRIDMLINNAAAAFNSNAPTPDGLEKTMALNHIAPFLLSALLWQRLKSSKGRIITLSSQAHQRISRFDPDSIDRKSSRGRYGGIKAYCESKLANLLFTYFLARRDSGVSVMAAHPGFVSTAIGSSNGLFPRVVWRLVSLFARTPEQGAQTPTFLAAYPDPTLLHGGYFINRKSALSSPLSYQVDLQRALWEKSLKVTRLSDSLFD